MLLQLSQFFPLLPHSVTPLPQSIPSPLFMSMGPAYKLPIPFPILYFTSPWLFCDYLFVLLNPLTSKMLFSKKAQAFPSLHIALRGGALALLIYFHCGRAPTFHSELPNFTSSVSTCKMEAESWIS